MADFLCGETWPYHAPPAAPGRQGVLDDVAVGVYDDRFVQSFWIDDDGSRIGLVRLFDLGDPTPMFDLRLAAQVRDRGLGREALRWLTAYLFTEFPSVKRIEATTRADNRAMRRVLRQCGYVKEAHYRAAWPAADNVTHDAVGYAILHSDWVSGSVTAPAWDDEADTEHTSSRPLGGPVGWDPAGPSRPGVEARRCAVAADEAARPPSATSYVGPDDSSSPSPAGSRPSRSSPVTSPPGWPKGTPWPASGRRPRAAVPGSRSSIP